MSAAKRKSFDAFKKLSPLATFLSESKIASVESWIDTGCLALNAIISKSLYGGIPDNKVVLISGEATTGKTYICARILANAAQMGKSILIVDTEGAYTPEMIAGFGLNPEEVMYYTPKSIEDCRNKLVSFYKMVEENNEQGQYIVCIDSLANMESAMEINRIDKDSDSTDMGTRARAIRSLLRNVTNWSNITRTPSIVTNHIYDDPSNMFEKTTLVKRQPGGKAVMYVPSISIQLTRSNAKEDDAKTEVGATALAAGQQRYPGCYMKALTIKNRFAKQFLEAELYLSFSSGLHKYAGIVELAKSFGILTADAHNYTLNGEKISKRGLTKEELCDKILPTLEERIKKEWSYSSDDLPNELLDTDEEESLDSLTPDKL